MQTLTKVAYEVSQKTQYTAKTEPFAIYEMQQKTFWNHCDFKTVFEFLNSSNLLLHFYLFTLSEYSSWAGLSLLQSSNPAVPSTRSQASLLTCSWPVHQPESLGPDGGGSIISSSHISGALLWFIRPLVLTNTLLPSLPASTQLLLRSSVWQWLFPSSMGGCPDWSVGSKAAISGLLIGSVVGRGWGARNLHSSCSLFQ